MSVTSRSTSSSEGDCMGEYSTCSGLFSTRSGMSSWSLLGLVGIVDAEEHGIPGMNAGHLHFSVRHSVHNSSWMFWDILICLNTVSKSKLAQCLCKSLRYWVPALPLAVCSGTESLLAPCALSIRLIFPGSWGYGALPPVTFILLFCLCSCSQPLFGQLLQVHNVSNGTMLCVWVWACSCSWVRESWSQESSVS